MHLVCIHWGHLYNFIKFDPSVAKAINPKYIIDYFQRNKKDAWISLGGVVLAITVRSIQISMCFLTYAALVLAYTRQASFLRKNNDLYEGQVYVPKANYLLMLACLAVTLGFRTTTNIGNAYGIAMVFVMTLSTSFLVLVMIMIWKTHLILVVCSILIIGSVELLYLSSVLYKFNQGGYLPLAFAAVLMVVMYTWNNLEHKISPEKLKEIADDTSLCRIPGLAMFYLELVQGIPPIFNHYVANVPALRTVLVFISIKSLPISKAPVKDRFHFCRVEPKELNVFHCVVIERLKDFIGDDFRSSQRLVLNNSGENVGEIADDRQVEEDHMQPAEAVEREIEGVDKAWHGGIVQFIAETEVIAKKGASFGKRILIDYAYTYLKRNSRDSDEVYDIPHKRMLKVGMTYEL
ncbi:potassium transporter 5 [Quercus suber]|uniref:Potassium transporter 5 n=1 Tax=Quercus suber TaxID=58331 RepID=A0AAW0KXY9_QUESU